MTPPEEPTTPPEPAGNPQAVPPARPAIPPRGRRLSDEREAGPDYIAPLAALGMIVAILGTTCLPLWTVMSMVAAGGAPDAPTTAPGQPPVGAPTNATLVAALVFFLIAVTGIVGGLGSLLRRQWGRRLMLAYAALVLLYLVTAVYLRFRFGIGGLTETAPTASALALSFTCVFGVLLLVAAVLVTILRYYTLPHVIRRFG